MRALDDALLEARGKDICVYVKVMANASTLEEQTQSQLRCWRTVLKIGSNPSTLASNLLSNALNPNRGAVLPKPFPWTVVQGFILVLVIINS